MKRQARKTRGSKLEHNLKKKACLNFRASTLSINSLRISLVSITLKS